MNFKNIIKSALYPIYERRLLRKLDLNRTPRHIGVILDGNRRWAKENPAVAGGLTSAHGHRAGAEKIIEFLSWCEETRVEVVTLWLLSSDNLKRSPEELAALLGIIGETVAGLQEARRWRIRFLGSMDLLPRHLQDILTAAESSTKDHDGITVNVAIGYGGRLEIVDAVKRYIRSAEEKSAAEIAEALDAEELEKFLYTAGQPDPELLIRTSGEQRLGGFLLWQSHQSEFYFCEAYWPDFRRVDYLRALRSFAQRQRRMGR
jgi:short-chain Z-isoprenyl diphosphate synthase